MNQADAIQKASEFTLKAMGRSVEPESATIVERPDGRRYWSIAYRQEAFLPDEAAAGAVMDGPYVLRVDDASGEVSVLG
ncbi:hypothetical protein Pla123a_49260 [Posidoniimonas polymericola]|uniref:PepSY domain-containing protein n=1 Tax=Posidoniimonas polymericola TaxID=2528002 RepID=A0A5C5XU88_9BACT|nr:hypothetical protein Pla123a_49260 [Posidoniimonas polymericola]